AFAPRVPDAAVLARSPELAGPAVVALHGHHRAGLRRRILRRQAPAVDPDLGFDAPGEGKPLIAVAVAIPDDERLAVGDIEALAGRALRRNHRVARHVRRSAGRGRLIARPFL